MPWLLVPIHRAFLLSESSVVTSNVRPSNSGTTNVFKIPSSIRCKPRLGPVRIIPTHKEPSDAKASDPMPLNPFAAANPGGTYLLEEVLFQRVRSSELPNQKSPFE